MQNIKKNIDKKWMIKNSFEKKFGSNHPPSFPNEMLVKVCKSSRYHNYNFNFQKKEFKLLEVGCFSGNNMRFFIENKIKCYGSEINQEMVNLCKKNLKRLKYKIPIIKIGDNENLNYDDNYFNMLVSINTIHYSYGDHLDKALSEYSRVVKKGGFVLIETPTINHYIVKKSKKISDFNFQWGLEGFRKNTNIGFVNNLNKFKKMIFKYFSSFQINYKNEIYGKYNCSSYFFICKK